MGVMKNEEQLNSEDELIRKLFQQSVTVPDRSLKEQIMKRVESQQKLEYTPVISKKTWWLIGTLFSAAIISVMLFGSKENLNDSFFGEELPSMDMNWLTDKLSKWVFTLDGLQMNVPELPFSFIPALSAVILLWVGFIISFQTKIFHTDN